MPSSAARPISAASSERASIVPVGLAGLATSTPARSARQVRRHRLEPVLRPGGDPHRHEVERAQDVAVARIARLADRHPVAGVEQAGEGQDEPRRRPGGHHHPPRIEIDPVPVAIEPRDPRPELRQPERHGVAERPRLPSPAPAPPAPRPAPACRAGRPPCGSPSAPAASSAARRLHHVHHDEGIDLAPA